MLKQLYKPIPVYTPESPERGRNSQRKKHAQHQRLHNQQILDVSEVFPEGEGSPGCNRLLVHSCCSHLRFSGRLHSMQFILVLLLLSVCAVPAAANAARHNHAVHAQADEEAGEYRQQDEDEQEAPAYLTVICSTCSCCLSDVVHDLR